MQSDLSKFLQYNDSCVFYLHVLLFGSSFLLGPFVFYLSKNVVKGRKIPVCREMFQSTFDKLYVHVHLTLYFVVYATIDFYGNNTGHFQEIAVLMLVYMTQNIVPYQNIYFIIILE